MKVALYTSRYPGEEFPVPPSLQYLGGMLRNAGVASDEEILFAESPDEVISFAPDLFGVSSVSQTIGDAVNTVQQVRAALPECWTALGGYHVSALPDALPTGFDLGVLGEGEDTLVELASLRARTDERNPEAWRDIRGLCFREAQGKVIRTEARPLRENLDDLPDPLYRIPYGQSWVQLNSSRGCPYHCRYCASQSFWGRFRAHSAEYLIAQAKRLMEGFGAGGVYFVDDLFIAPPHRLRTFHRLLKQEGLLGRIGFKGFVRINLMTAEVVNILKEIGFTDIRFGMETASPRLLNAIKDQPFTVEKVDSVIEWCNRAGLPVNASFMFGLPGEEEADIEATAAFLRKHRGCFRVAGCYLFQPVPGSDYWRQFLEQGRVSPEMDFSRMQLDLTRSELDWGHLFYANEERIPRARFRQLTREIMAEFVTGTPVPASGGLMRSVIQQGKGFVRRVLARIGYEVRRLPTSPHSLPTKVGKGGRVYVGCGEDQRPGFIGCDVRPLSSVGVVCPAWNVSKHFSDLEEIFSRHLLEHLTFNEAEAALTDWLHALKLDGRLHLVVPDMDAHVRQWQQAQWTEEARCNPRSEAAHASAGFWGYQRGNEVHGQTGYWDVHKSGYNAASLTALLTRLGYWDVRCRTVSGFHLVAAASKFLDPGECQVRPHLSLIDPSHRERYVFAASRVNAGAKVLDVACGIGYGSYLLAERSACASVHAVDRNPRALEYGERYYGSQKVQRSQVDILKDEFPGGTYDAAVSFETIEHLRDTDVLLRKLHAALKPGGQLILSTPNRETMPFDARRFPFHVRHFTLEEIRERVSRAGFEVSGVWSQPDRSNGRVIDGGSGLYLLIEAHRAGITS